jgi:uncharacterized protein (TIGR03085 family)
MSDYAQQERRTLVDVMTGLGPEAPTLCEGWNTADLAAHLVIRERRPDAGPGIVVPALAGHTQRVQNKVSDSRTWQQLLADVASGPPLLLRPVDEPMNAVEYFIHVEDVRRAQPEWEPRDLDPEFERALWSRARMMAKGLRKRAPTSVTLQAPGYGEVQGRQGEPHVRVVGPPGELVLFASGRQQAARVEMMGDPGPVDQLRQAKLGI